MKKEKVKKIVIISISVLILFSLLFTLFKLQKYTILTQLSPQSSTQMMGYIIKTNNGKVIVIDGGTILDAKNLEKYVKDSGGKIDYWFLTHAHHDHVGAFTEIVKNTDIQIENIYASVNELSWYEKNEESRLEFTKDFLNTLKLDKIKDKVKEPKINEKIQIDNIEIEILGIKNPEIIENAGNEQSMVFTVSTGKTKILILGDTGEKSGEKLLTTHKEKLAELGIIFCSFSEAVKDYPDLVKRYLGSVVSYRDNFFAALNSAVFSDGSFVYIPKGVRCPMELSTYFRINASGTGQFERTLIVADDDAYVSYLEGCTAPMRDENQLHAAIVEIVVEDRAEVKYSTVQNWYSGDKDGKGGVYNFVTKRGLCRGDYSKLSWTQVETGSAITWKYPSCILAGEGAVGEFYSVAVTKNHQQADTGTKMIHTGRNTRSTIVSKGISAGYSQNSYRGLVKVAPNADGCRNYTQCDSLLLSSHCAHTFPYIDVLNDTAVVEHEATTSKINEDQIFYCNQRGIPTEEAIGLIVNGYAKEVMNKLPMEFAVEAQKLLQITLEGSVG